ncbi:MAG: cupredoxin domain-containing protein [Deltaproteobacteria bacterium]
MKTKIIISILALFLSHMHPALGADAEPPPQAENRDMAAQKIEIVVDSYSFTPEHITATAGIPVEITLRSVTSLIPHNFTINDPDSGLDIDIDVPSGKDVTVTFTPSEKGKFQFYCNKKGIFGSHIKKGMKGYIEVQ